MYYLLLSPLLHRAYYYYNHFIVLQERRNYVEVLEDFSTLCLPVAALLELLPVLRPRSYSLASDSELFPNEVG